MRTGFHDRGPFVSEMEVAAFEERCGCRLPSDYRQFLLDQNGGERALPPRAPEEDEEEAEEEGQRTLRFFSLGAAATLKVPGECACRATCSGRCVSACADQQPSSGGSNAR
jgi:hypothetical protein